MKIANKTDTMTELDKIFVFQCKYNFKSKWPSIIKYKTKIKDFLEYLMYHLFLAH